MPSSGRLCNLSPLALPAFELPFHSFTQAKPVVADVVFLPLLELRPGGRPHSLLNELRADRLVVQGDG